MLFSLESLVICTNWKVSWNGQRYSSFRRSLTTHAPSPHSFSQDEERRGQLPFSLSSVVKLEWPAFRTDPQPPWMTFLSFLWNRTQSLSPVDDQACSREMSNEQMQLELYPFPKQQAEPVLDRSCIVIEPISVHETSRSLESRDWARNRDGGRKIVERFSTFS